VAAAAPAGQLSGELEPQMPIVLRY